MRYNGSLLSSQTEVGELNLNYSLPDSSAGAYLLANRTCATCSVGTFSRVANNASVCLPCGGFGSSAASCTSPGGLPLTWLAILFFSLSS